MVRAAQGEEEGEGQGGKAKTHEENATIQPEKDDGDTGNLRDLTLITSSVAKKM